MNKRIGRNDIILILSLLAIGLLAWAVIYFLNNTSGDNVKVTVDGDLYGTYSLNQNQTIEIKDGDGQTTNVLVIEDGYADMTEADCPDKLCVNQSKISLNNQNIVCLPNKVVVTVISSENSDVDAVAN